MQQRAATGVKPPTRRAAHAAAPSAKGDVGVPVTMGSARLIEAGTVLRGLAIEAVGQLGGAPGAIGRRGADGGCSRPTLS